MKGQITKATIFLTLAAAYAFGQSDQALIVQAFRADTEGFYNNHNGKCNVFWNDVFLMYELLYTDSLLPQRTGLGPFPDSMIHVLYADGDDYDHELQGKRYSPNHWLGITGRITDGPAFKDTGLRYLHGLAYSDTSGYPHLHPLDGGTFLCYTFGHGDWSKGRANLGVRPLTLIKPDGGGWYFRGDSLFDYEFADSCNKIACDDRVFIGAQCYSGGFIDDLANDNTSMICAAAGGYKSYVADGHARIRPVVDSLENETAGDTAYYHSEFNYYLMNALRGYRPAGAGPNPWDTQPPLSYFDPDTNGDSHLSWDEVYHYVDSLDSRERPVLWMPGRAWMPRSDMPLAPSGKPVRADGALAVLRSDTLDSLRGTLKIFALKGGNRNDFYSFDVDYNTWNQLETIPGIGASGKKKYVKKGGTLCADSNRVYAFKGGGTLEFWRLLAVWCGFYHESADAPETVS